MNNQTITIFNKSSQHLGIGGFTISPYTSLTVSQKDITNTPVFLAELDDHVKQSRVLTTFNDGIPKAHFYESGASGAETVLTLAATSYNLAAQTWALGVSSDFNFNTTTGILTYVGTLGRAFKVSGFVDAVPLNKEDSIWVSVELNGTLVTALKQSTYFIVNFREHIGFGGIVNLTYGDTLNLCAASVVETGTRFHVYKSSLTVSSY